jgi:hypothetical protein
VSVGAGPSSSAIVGNSVSRFIGRVLHFGISKRVEGSAEAEDAGFFCMHSCSKFFVSCGTSEGKSVLLINSTIINKR